MHGRLTPSRTFVLALALAGGCFHGFDVEDKQPPPGHAGGSCLQGSCYTPNTCLADENVCLDPSDPCKGFYCGSKGTCGIDLDSNLPVCTCDAGYSNEPYAYFCIPIGS